MNLSILNLLVADTPYFIHYIFECKDGIQILGNEVKQKENLTGLHESNTYIIQI